jgi:hypothetical protein
MNTDENMHESALKTIDLPRLLEKDATDVTTRVSTPHRVPPPQIDSLVTGVQKVKIPNAYADIPKNSSI